MNSLLSKVGIAYAFTGLSLLKQNKHLWKLCYIPVIATLILFLPAMYFIPDFFSWLSEILKPDILMVDNILDYFHSNANVILRWLAMIFGGFLALIYSVLVWVLIFAAIVIIMVMIFVMFLKVIAAPFNDLLSKAIEDLTDKSISDEEISFWASVKVAALSEGQRFLIFLAIAIPLYLFSFLLPGIGGAIVALLIIIYSCLWYTYDAMSYSMDRYGWPIKKRMKLILKHPGRSFGFGLGVYLIAIIPLINLMIMPLFVSGGTLLFLDLNKQEGNKINFDDLEGNDGIKAPKEVLTNETIDIAEEIADEDSKIV